MVDSLEIKEEEIVTEEEVEKRDFLRSIFNAIIFKSMDIFLMNSTSIKNQMKLKQRMDRHEDDDDDLVLLMVTTK